METLQYNITPNSALPSFAQKNFGSVNEHLYLGLLKILHYLLLCSLINQSQYHHLQKQSLDPLEPLLAFT